MKRQSSFKRDSNYYNVEMNAVTSSGPSRFAKNRHKRRSKTMPISLPSLVRSDSFSSVKQLAKMFEVRVMSEGRKTQILLLDDRKLEILIQPKLYAGELLDLVASHFSLKEKEYFGLAFKDDTEHFHWLQLDRRVLEHEFPAKKPSEPLLLYFSVRFFIESIAYLRDSATVELFFLQAKHSLYNKGSLECDSETVFELAAHVLQSAVGDYVDDNTARKHLKKLPVLPTSTLKEHPSLSYCEDRVIEHYRKLSGTQRGHAVVNYMTIVERLPTYGIHYYEVKDKSGIPWWLGLSYKGISLYDYSDKRVPRRVFAWKQLENLYFRDKKFSIEVHDPKRIVHTLSSFNLYEDAIQESVDEFDELSDAISDPTTQVSVSRRTFGPGNVNVHAWFAATPQLTKCIWSMAVSQHQFYLDRKQSKSQLPSVRSMSEIAADLCTSTTSLPSSGYSGDNISRSNSVASIGQLSSHNSKTELTQEDIDASRQAQRDMYSALKARKEALEEEMRKKTEKLKELCLKEAELTGELPFETPLTPGEPLPQIRRRVGTAFTLSPNILLLKDKVTEDEEVISRLELEYELQNKITEAAMRLAKDHTVAKNVRKKRKQSYHKASQKLKDIEKKLNDFRSHQGKIPVHKNYNSADELSEDSREFLDSDNEVLSPVSSPHISRVPHYPRSNSQGQVRIISSPKVEVVELDHQNYMRPSTPSSQGSGQRSGSPSSQGRHPYSHGISRGSTPSPGPQRHYAAGERYTPSSVYTTRTMYRNQTYPTFNQSNHHSTNQNPPNNHGNNSDYDNTYDGGSQQSNADNRSVSSSHMSVHNIPNSPQHGSATSHQDYVHNLYNLNLNRTSHYESGDELKSPSHHPEYYDSFPMDNSHPHYQSRGIPRTNSFESNHSSNTTRSNEGYNRGYNNQVGYHQYGSLDRNTGLPYRQDDELSEMSISELQPSKFGSKRESHSDKRDSPYYAPDNYNRHHDNSGQHPHSNHHYQHGQSHQHGHYNHPPHHQEYGVPSQGSAGERTPQQINSSHSSLTSSSSSNYYDHHQQQQHRDVGTVRQQAPPSTPQFESPPPAFIRQEQHGNYPQQQHSVMYNESPQHSQQQIAAPAASAQQPQQRPMTVTKYSNYVEVSKPFEMADVYKYSEKIRKTKPGDGQMSPSGSSQHSSQGSMQRLNSPYMQRASHMANHSRSSSPSSQEPSPYNTPSSRYPQSHPTPQYSAGSVQTGYTPSGGNPGYSNSSTNQNVRHMQYQSPPTQQHYSPGQGHSNSGTPHRSLNETVNQSFGSFHNDSVSRAFSQEMLAWYEDQENTEPQSPQDSSTLV